MVALFTFSCNATSYFFCKVINSSFKKVLLISLHSFLETTIDFFAESNSKTST